MTAFFDDEIVRLKLGSANATVVAGPSKDLNGPTACNFGRTVADSNVLYVTTNGGLAAGDTSPKPGGTLSRINLGLHHDHRRARSNRRVHTQTHSHTLRVRHRS